MFFIGLLSLTRLQGEFFAKLAGVGGMLVRLYGQLVSSEMISFTVGGCRCKVGMGRKVMQLGDSIVRALWHGLLLIV
jgi:alpha-galactosidase